MAIANQKGGVGKTTTAVNLAVALSLKGKQVLLLDLDPQLNASSGLGINEDKSRNIYRVLTGEALLKDVIKHVENALYIIPGTRDLAGLAVELVYIDNWQMLLKKKLAEIENFDYIILDTPPSIGPFTVLSLVASDSVIIPIQCEYYALEGLSQLTRTIKYVKDAFNPDIRIRGLILTMYDKRVNLSKQIEDDVRKYFGRKVFQTVIPRSIRIAESPGFGMSIFRYAPDSAGSVSYIRLAEEVLNAN